MIEIIAIKNLAKADLVYSKNAYGGGF